MIYDKFVEQAITGPGRTNLNWPTLVAKLIGCPRCHVTPGAACRALDPPHERTGTIHMERRRMFVEMAKGASLR